MLWPLTLACLNFDLNCHLFNGLLYYFFHVQRFITFFVSVFYILVVAVVDVVVFFFFFFYVFALLIMMIRNGRIDVEKFCVSLYVVSVSSHEK